MAFFAARRGSASRPVRERSAMDETASTRLYCRTISLLLALLPLSLVVHTRLKALIPFALFLIGLHLCLTRAEVRHRWRRAGPVLGAALLYMAFAIANTLGHGLGWAPLDGTGHILLYLVIAATFTAALDTRILWCGFSLTAAACGVLCMVQHFGWHTARAYSPDGGASTAIAFATVMLGLALMALVQLLRARLNRLERVIHAAGLILGGYGALLTQSRGPLLAFTLALLLLLFLRSRQHGQWRFLLSGAAVFFVSAAVAMTTLHGAILQRFTHIDQQLSLAHAGKVDGSVSARLAMWRTATHAFIEHPWAGIGLDRFQAYTRAEVAAGRSDAAIARYNNPHNMYLGAAATGGVPGLLALLIVLLAPLIWFARHVGSTDERTATAAWSGLAIAVLYLGCALTDSVFYRNMTQSFYFFLVLGLAMFIASRRDARTASSPTTDHGGSR